MLSITSTAAQAIEILLEDGPGTDGGLRIARQWSVTREEAYLAFTVESLPGSSDAVIVEQGARLFLAPEAAELLTDMVLDARVEETSVEFRISKR